MLTDYFEPFTLMERTASADGLGGKCAEFTPVTCFRGALTHTCGEEISPGGRAALRMTPMLLHETDVTLLPGDWVQRERDGSLWRVKGASDGMRTPAFSGLQFAQVPIEGVQL
ncbi:MAG: hypothetical protein IKK57_00815 [Clostridia bacterium]|nr:hypothetical protein [Clostridia bacterium]